jgi:four helix bundle protein
MTLAEHVYHDTNRFPAEERCGLTQQLRHTALSIPSQLAQSLAKSSDQFLLDLRDVDALLGQLETELVLANRLDYLPSSALTKHGQQIAEVHQRLRALRRSLGDKSYQKFE